VKVVYGWVLASHDRHRHVETGWGLAVEIVVKLPNATDRAAAQKVLELAHAGCPYSNATRGNIPVTVTLAE
jgi:organic hydroperoxide reductase OsmC/OhrA